MPGILAVLSDFFHTGFKKLCETKVIGIHDLYQRQLL